MTNSSLLPLTFLLVLTAWWPLAGAWSDVSCGGGGYVPNSTYEANLRRLVAVLPAEVSAARGRYVDRAIGYWPNRLQVSSRCRSRDGDCAACISNAFEELERTCPFRTEAFFFSGNCSLSLDEFRIVDVDLFGRNILASGMIFQAIGLLCLFFLFLQAWRHDTKKATIMRCTSPPSGDQ